MPTLKWGLLRPPQHPCQFSEWKRRQPNDRPDDYVRELENYDNIRSGIVELYKTARSAAARDVNHSQPVRVITALGLWSGRRDSQAI
jgi:hypothetical protein